MQAITIIARYVPESPSPAPPPLPTFIARYDLIHTLKPNNTRIILADDDRRLSSAVASWKHSSDFFESFKGQQLIRDFDNSWSRLLMARKTATTQTYNRPEWKGFLECPLTAEQLAACDDWKPRSVDLWEHVNALIASGLDLSLSWQSRDKVYTATLKDQRSDSKTAGYAISSRDGDAQGALKIAVWKHNALLTGDWTSLLDAPKVAKRG